MDIRLIQHISKPTQEQPTMGGVSDNIQTDSYLLSRYSYNDTYFLIIFFNVYGATAG
jgi:hypothetical protein